MDRSLWSPRSSILTHMAHTRLMERKTFFDTTNQILRRWSSCPTKKTGTPDKKKVPSRYWFLLFYIFWGIACPLFLGLPNHSQKCHRPQKTGTSAVAVAGILVWCRSSATENARTLQKWVCLKLGNTNSNGSSCFLSTSLEFWNTFSNTATAGQQQLRADAAALPHVVQLL